MSVRNLQLTKSKTNWTDLQPNWQKYNLKSARNLQLTKPDSIAEARDEKVARIFPLPSVPTLHVLSKKIFIDDENFGALVPTFFGCSSRWFMGAELGAEVSS